MVDVDRAVIARLKKGEHVFEILVDCDNALAFKKGKAISLGDIVATDEIFKDVKNGEKASTNVLETVFKTTDVEEISKIIIKDGDIQLTAKHKAEMREEKKKRIINIIHRNAVDSKTGLPHPPQRIESAMNEEDIALPVHAHPTLGEMSMEAAEKAIGNPIQTL